MRIDFKEMELALAGVGYLVVWAGWLWVCFEAARRWFPRNPYSPPWLDVAELALVWFAGLFGVQALLALAFLRAG